MPGFDAGGFTTWQALPEVLPLWTLMLRAPPHNVPWLAAMKPDPQDIGRWLRGCGWKETKSKWVECRQRSSSLNYLYMYNMYIILYILCVYVTHIYTRCSLPLKDTHPYLKLPWKKEAHYMFIWLGRASFESSPLFGPFHLPRRTPGHQLVEKGIADPFLRSQFLQPPKAQKTRSGVGTWVWLNLLVFCASTRFTRFNHFTRFRMHCTCICGSSVIKPLETMGPSNDLPDTARILWASRLCHEATQQSSWKQSQWSIGTPSVSKNGWMVVGHLLKFLEEARLFGRGMKLDQIRIVRMIYRVVTERYPML